MNNMAINLSNPSFLQFKSIIPPFQSVKQAVKTTGCSERFIRDGIKAGHIAHLKSGVKYLVNVPALLAQLDEASKEGGVIGKR